MKRNKVRSLALIFVPVFIYVFSACGNRPSNVLKEKEMVSLMVDMELAEAYSNTQNHIQNSEKTEMGKRVMELHGVSEETLDTTLAWYGRNMDEYSQLFEKVDKELEKRRKKYTELPGELLKEGDDLWIFSPHLTISPLSGEDALNFSIPNPEIEKGEILHLSFFLPNSTNIKGTFGVEYKDGSGEASVSNSNNKHNIKIELQTDTAKEVSRIFGSMHVKDLKALPLYIDSISLKAEPFDSTSYRTKKRLQKSFFPLSN